MSTSEPGTSSQEGLVEVRTFHESITSGCGGAAGAVVLPVLWAASKAYGLAIDIRNRRFDQPGASCRVAVPVISVGNITTGGTGKTPMTIDIASRLVSMGRTTAVIARGYKARPGEPPDELQLIQRAVPEAICLADADRVAGATRAIGKHGADVIVLDDGFQHRRIARDLDIVLVDATNPFGRNHLLPRGFLREPITSLSRADLIVLTRVDQVESEVLADLRRRLIEVAGSTPCVLTAHVPGPLRVLGGESPVEPDGTTSTVHLLSGIGNPAAFRRTVEGIGLTVASETRLGDHHRFVNSDMDRVCGEARRGGCQAIVTTAKDAVKIERLDGASWSVPIWVVDVRVEFVDDGGSVLDKMLRGAL